MVQAEVLALQGRAGRSGLVQPGEFNLWGQHQGNGTKSLLAMHMRHLRAQIIPDTYNLLDQGLHIATFTYTLVT